MSLQHPILAAHKVSHTVHIFMLYYTLITKLLIALQFTPRDTTIIREGIIEFMNGSHRLLIDVSLTVQPPALSLFVIRSTALQMEFKLVQ